MAVVEDLEGKRILTPDEGHQVLVGETLELGPGHILPSFGNDLVDLRPRKWLRAVQRNGS